MRIPVKNAEIARYIQSISLRFATLLHTAMFDGLKNKWKVGGWQLLLILCTFALGGSMCGYLGRKVLSLFPLEKGVLWFIVYILLITLLWPICVLVISIPFGQFAFFKNYLQRIWKRMTGKKTS